MEHDPLSRTTRRTRTSLIIVSTATILSLTHNDQIDLAILKIALPEDLLFQIYSIVVIYCLIFFVYYCFHDYANHKGEFFSYSQTAEKRYHNFLESSFSSLLRNAIMRDSIRPNKNFEDGPNSYSNALMGVEQAVVRNLHSCISKHSKNRLWNDRKRTENFIKDLQETLHSDSQTQEFLGPNTASILRETTSSILQSRSPDITAKSYPFLSSFHLWIFEICLPVVLGITALWINLAAPYSSQIVNLLVGVTNLLHNPIQ